MMWALAWFCGSQFQVGALSHYSLIASKSVDLPLVPAFGILPSDVPSVSGRAVIAMIPIILGFLACLIGLWTEKGFFRRLFGKLSKRPSTVMAHRQGSHQILQAVIRKALYSLGSLVCAAIILTVLLPIFFQLTNGSLGTNDLASVGVTTFAAVQSVARPIFAGYLIALIVGVAVFSIVEEVREHRPIVVDSLLSGLDDASGTDDSENGDNA
jgi:hypothetical protein